MSAKAWQIGTAEGLRLTAASQCEYPARLGVSAGENQDMGGKEGQAAPNGFSRTVFAKAGVSPNLFH